MLKSVVSVSLPEMRRHILHALHRQADCASGTFNSEGCARMSTLF